MLTAISHGALFLGMLVGTITDLKTREVPDWLNYAIIAVGVSAGLFTSILHGSIFPLVWSLLGLLIGVAVGYGMYYAGQWGGGDAKLFMGVGAILGYNLGIPVIQNYLVSFALWWIFVGSIYGLVWSAYLAVRDWPKFKKYYRGLLKDPNMITKRKIMLVTSFILVISILWAPGEFKLVLLLVALLIFSVFYLMLAVRSVERTAMIKKVKVSELTEGDWLWEPVKIKNKIIVETTNTGLEIKDLKKLMKKLPRGHAVIRQGIPFVPVFFIAYVIMMIVGSPLLMVF